ncbi:MAG: response regulator [Proteobacteria bacterium]|nr:response regulator [Pseudomonadota bacterium]MBU1649307.1 response regulator [Pseudomonadota bacterium]
MNTSSSISGKGLYVLLTIFLFGFSLLLLQHSLFESLNDKLETQVENEHNRIVIGEMIIVDLRQVEALFYRLPTSTDPETQQLLHDNILATLARINQSLRIIENGGTIDFHLPLNLPEHDEMITTVHYQPSHKETYILEIIDLRPKLADITEKTDTLIELARTRDELQGSKNIAEWKGSINIIKDFLKKVSPSFVRMNENANQLFFNSRESLSHFEKIVDAKHKQYEQLQTFLIFGTILTVLLFTTNVYRKQQAMAELQRSKDALANAYRRFAGIVDGLDNIVYVSDLATHEILFVNRYARQRVGDVVGRKCYQIFGEAGNEGICSCCSDRKAQLDPGQPGCEFTSERKEDDKWYEIHGQMIDWDDNRKAFHVLVFDISERKKAQLERQEVEERQHRFQKMEAIAMMAGGVAHDLNNILAGIVSYPDLLLLDQPEGSPMHRPLTIIKQAGKRAAAIVDDLLTVARGIAQRKEPVDLNQIIDQYLNSPEFSQLSTRYPNISYSTDLTDKPTLLTGSSVQIIKALMNLVTNAAEAIDGSGKILISTSVDSSLDLGSSPKIILRVSDNGPGIADEDLERIFEPFYSSKVMGRSGTGLGLAVVWNVIQEHGGTVEAVSSQSGTTFEIQLPASKDNILTPSQTQKESLVIGHGEEILVVDDDEQQRLIAASMLKRLGYTARAVKSGEEAITFIKDNKTELVLLDMIMPPGMGGRQTYEKIITIRPGQKALLASGFSASNEVRRAIELGASGFLRKPYTINQLAEAINNALS